LSRDEINDTTWLFSDSCFYEVVPIREDRDIWRLYLEQQQFEEALLHVNEENRILVLDAQANYYFEQKEYELAAKFFASSKRTFEEVALKLIKYGAIRALKTYLMLKLHAYVEKDSTPGVPPQVILPILKV
jgi:hypothetical protein